MKEVVTVGMVLLKDHGFDVDRSTAEEGIGLPHLVPW